MRNESTIDSRSIETQQLEIEKQRLECEKLRAEIEQVRLTWWKRPGYIGGLAPIVLALIGFFSAWTSGYFDTQRSNLDTQVESLKVKKDALENANQEIQRRIDDAYLRLKVAAYEASYAIGHVRGLGPPPEDVRDKVDAALDKIPVGVAEIFREVFHQYESTSEIIKITENDLNALHHSLSNIPASDWAAELQPEPGSTLRAPDGRYYHLEDQRYYDREEFWDLRDNIPNSR